jgi:hypothetical protein
MHSSNEEQRVYEGVSHPVLQHPPCPASPTLSCRAHLVLQRPPFPAAPTLSCSSLRSLSSLRRHARTSFCRVRVRTSSTSSPALGSSLQPATCRARYRVINRYVTALPTVMLPRYQPLCYCVTNRYVYTLSTRMLPRYQPLCYRVTNRYVTRSTISTAPPHVLDKSYKICIKYICFISRRMVDKK